MSVTFRIIFAGSHNFSAQHLDALLSSEHQIVGVLTQPDRPVGRGRKVAPTPVKMLAEKWKIPVFQPTSFSQKESQQFIAQFNADIMIVVSYSLILPESILKIPNLGCINVHASLLPRWRGAAPIQRSIWAGDTQTGITIIKMDCGIDTGDILYRESCSIAITDTSGTLCAKLVKIGKRGLIKTLQKLSEGNFQSEKQNNKEISYAKKISKEEARINWSLSAIQLERHIRAFNPQPISWLEVDGQPIKIWKASIIKSNLNTTAPGTILKANRKGIQVKTSQDILNLEFLQPSSRKIMSAQDILNSSHFFKCFTPGNRLA